MWTRFHNSFILRRQTIQCFKVRQAGENARTDRGARRSVACRQRAERRRRERRRRLNNERQQQRKRKHRRRRQKIVVRIVVGVAVGRRRQQLTDRVRLAAAHDYRRHCGISLASLRGDQRHAPTTSTVSHGLAARPL